MYSEEIRQRLGETLEEIRSSGLYKSERIIASPQSARVRVGEKEVLNFCANNYLGLANDSRLIKAAKDALDRYGFGLSSVRFICGTQTIHKELERKISDFLETDDAILYTSCFDANGGLFETLLGKNDAIISDSLNHASIIDGIRLCPAKRYIYDHGNMESLREQLEQSRKDGAEKVMIATDGVFSMDGDYADLQAICGLAEEFGALVMVDDSHATGFVGKRGRGSVEECGVMGRVDIITSTLGKALGGASGGFTTGRKEIIELLRQRSRPYLFSNSLPPALVAAGIACLEMLSSTTELRDKLQQNTTYFRTEISRLGYNIREGSHPIVPIMLGEAKLAVSIAEDMLEEGIYVIGFSYPVVPKGAARIRVQISAAHSRDDLDRAIEAFRKVGAKHGVC
ncbi:MAG: glycine C-acetyltransferase [Candidatus Dadabacteria bacterium]|nr:MAG: glycine C-acetyltransferase [Candidatus Dadabacteria bacterium]